ncbi:MAG TPA: Ppx/GppA phosphatase family protein [Hyphomicrobiaceae bacterium]|nr:Ppx/GppA phosphatase family protein [Hyphomicrobiaceae bacterium]
MEGPSDERRGAPLTGGTGVVDGAIGEPRGHAAKAALNLAGPTPSARPAEGPLRYAAQPIAARQSGGERFALYAALDLGTNNCRLLIARPTRRGFHVVDAFSRIIRLGEGVMTTGMLSEAAMARTMEALKVCAAKMARHRVRRAKLVATEACRIASNGPEFIARVRKELGLELEVLTCEEEAKLAVSGCASLIDPRADLALVFDIGGGSSELIWLDLARRKGRWQRSLADRLDAHACITAWTSVPAGVVTLAERHGGRHVSEASFEAMIAEVSSHLAPFEERHGFRERLAHGNAHLLGTSGTVTTLAGILLGLERYDRRRVDGCWLEVGDVRRISYGLLRRSYEERVAEPCIGRERADLVLAGCAILEALLRMWPVRRLRVADRGLREGMLATLMAEDGHFLASGGKGASSRFCGQRSSRR